MNILRFIVFLTFFSTVYFLMNYTVVRKLWDYCGCPEQRALMIVIVLLLVFSFPLAMIGARQIPGSFSRMFYLLSTGAMGAVTISLAIILLNEILKKLLPLDAVYLNRAALLIIAALTVYALVQGSRLKIREFEFTLPGLKEELRLVHLSDIHLGIVNNRKFVNKMVSTVNPLNADIIVITGDLFDGSRHPEERCVEGFSALNAPVYMCSGNHDMYEGLDRVATVLENSAIRYLRNESVVIRGLELIGVEHPRNDMQKQGNIPEHLPGCPELPSVLLYHLPSGLKQAADKGIDLQLSGHTHNGQIWPFNYLVRLAFPKGFGWQSEGRLRLYTSPGTGTWGPPMRLGSLNTVTLHILKPEGNTSRSEPLIQAGAQRAEK